MTDTERTAHLRELSRLDLLVGELRQSTLALTAQRDAARAELADEQRHYANLREAAIGALRWMPSVTAPDEDAAQATRALRDALAGCK